MKPTSNTGATSHKGPQLVMQRYSLSDLPHTALPAGFSIRHYQPGDDAHWERILSASFETAFESGSFQRIMRDDFAFRAERVLFVCRDEEPLGTAAAYYRPHFGRETGYLHYVAISPAATGFGLGLQISLACMHQMVREGRTSAVLLTDDHRIPALKTYLKLGYAPLITDESHRDRWRDVFAVLDRPNLISQFEAELTAPCFTCIEKRENIDSLDRYKLRRKWLPNREHRTRNGAADTDVMTDEALYRPSQLGTATVWPERPLAGSTLSAGFALTYTAGSRGLPVGAVVGFGIRGQGPLGFTWQTTDESGPGFMRISAPEGCRLEAAGQGFRVADSGLQPGQTVELSLAPTDTLTWNRVAGRREVKVAVSMAPGEADMRLPAPLIIDIMPGPLHHLEAIMPCTNDGEASLRTHITARDQFQNRIGLNGMVTMTAGEQSHSCGMRDGLAIGEVNSVANSATRVQARLEELDVPCRSNISVPTTELNLYIGDLHCHDHLSEAEGYPDAVYEWARDTQRLDFLCLSPQGHAWHDNETWTITKYMNERFLDEGRFVSLLGFEWQHSGYGDKVIHYLGGDQPYLPADDPRYHSPQQLYEALRVSDAFIISHHPAYPIQWVPGTEYSVVETDVERLIELWSMHGSSEGYDPADRPLRTIDPERYVMQALRRGLRLGFVGGSDTHSGRPGGSAREVGGYWGGLAAVWAPALTRSSLFKSLHARHTYALTGARIVLKMTVNGALMGSEIEAAPTAAIKVDVWAPGTIAKVEIMKNSHVWREFGPSNDAKDECHLEIEDQTRGAAYYHCRVTQTDGELAVGSPVWVG